MAYRSVLEIGAAGAIKQVYRVIGTGASATLASLIATATGAGSYSFPIPMSALLLMTEDGSNIRFTIDGTAASATKPLMNPNSLAQTMGMEAAQAQVMNVLINTGVGCTVEIAAPRTQD